MKESVKVIIWPRPGWGRLDNFRTFGREARAYKPVCRKIPSRLCRDTAGLSGWPFSEPCKAGADGRLLRCDPSTCETCSVNEPLFLNCPIQYRQRSYASEGWGVPAVLLRHRTVDRVGLPKRAPFSPTFRWPERYGHFPRGKCSNEAVQY